LVDVVISNCVINLSPDKEKVFREIARVLRPGGRVAVSDVALLRPLPEEILADVRAYVGCISGAVPIEEYVGHIRSAGLIDVSVRPKGGTDAMDMEVNDPLYKRMIEKLAGTRPSDRRERGMPKPGSRSAGRISHRGRKKVTEGASSEKAARGGPPHMDNRCSGNHPPGRVNPASEWVVRCDGPDQADPTYPDPAKPAGPAQTRLYLVAFLLR
jgi:hypothetical protein